MICDYCGANRPENMFYDDRCVLCAIRDVQKRCVPTVIIRDAINAVCDCGGRGPDDNPCPACQVWHIINNRVSKENKL